MEQNRQDKDLKDRDRIIIRKIRPRYKKILIPFLIISLIVAIILIWMTNKYLFKPIFEGKGSIRESSRTLAVRSASGSQNKEIVVFEKEECKL
jgi:Na+/citrate or Na+/malate symporter